MSPRMVEQLRALPDVLDVCEVRLWSMQPDFWQHIADGIAEASMTEGCLFVCWGPSDRYGNCPVRCVEANSFSDVVAWCSGLRPLVRKRDETGRPIDTLWARPSDPSRLVPA